MWQGCSGFVDAVVLDYLSCELYKVSRSTLRSFALSWLHAEKQKASEIDSEGQGRSVAGSVFRGRPRIG